MGWEKRRRKLVYYRSVRRNHQVVKIYCGHGIRGQIAAEMDARRREERQSQMAAWHVEKARYGELQALCQKLQLWTGLLAEVALLTSGFHKPNRVGWRRWYAAIRANQTWRRTSRRS